MLYNIYVIISLMCLRKMSYVERMQRISDYRELRRNRPRRIGARIITTPRVTRTTAQQQRVRQLTDELDQYRMKSEHTLCEHVRLVNQKIEDLIHSGKRLGNVSKIYQLFSTLPFWYGQRLLRLWDTHDKISYDELVAVFFKDNIWHNLNRTSNLAISPNLRISKGPSLNFPWLKKMTTSIMDKEKIEESMPRAIRFK